MKFGCTSSWERKTHVGYPQRERRVSLAWEPWLGTVTLPRSYHLELGAPSEGGTLRGEGRKQSGHFCDPSESVSSLGRSLFQEEGKTSSVCCIASSRVLHSFKWIPEGKGKRGISNLCPSWEKRWGVAHKSFLLVSLSRPCVAIPMKRHRIVLAVTALQEYCT